MKKYKAVIFDWDGTLMDSEARIVDAIQVAAKKCNLPVLSDNDSKEIIGLSLKNAILGLYPDIKPSQEAEMEVAYMQHFLTGSDVQMEAFDGAESLLYSLRQHGIKLAVATGKSRKGLNHVLAKCGFGVYFDITRTSDESASKPDPLMLEQILKEFDLTADEVVMVGDSTFDMAMAETVEMDRVALAHGVHKMEVLAKFNPIAQLDSLQELNVWLMEHI